MPSRLPELYLLSVMAHPELEIAEAAIGAIMMALPAAIRRILEARMQRYEYQSDFVRKYYGQGVAEGFEKGLVGSLDPG